MQTNNSSNYNTNETNNTRETVKQTYTYSATITPNLFTGEMQTDKILTRVCKGIEETGAKLDIEIRTRASESDSMMEKAWAQAKGLAPGLGVRDAMVLDINEKEMRKTNGLLANPAEMNLLTYYRKREVPVGTYYQRKMQRRRLNSDHKPRTEKELEEREDLQKSAPSVASESQYSTHKTFVTENQNHRILSGIKECDYEGSSHPRPIVSLGHESKINKALFDEEFNHRIKEINRSSSGTSSKMSDFTQGIMLTNKETGLQHIPSNQGSIQNTSINGLNSNSMIFKTTNKPTEIHVTEKRTSLNNTQSQIETKEEFFNGKGEVIHTTHVTTKTTSIYDRNPVASNYRSVDHKSQLQPEANVSAQGAMSMAGEINSERVGIFGAQQAPNQQIRAPIVSDSADLEKVAMSTYSKSGMKRGIHLGQKVPAGHNSGMNMSNRYSDFVKIQSSQDPRSEKSEKIQSSSSRTDMPMEIKNNLEEGNNRAIGDKSAERLQLYETPGMILLSTHKERQLVMIKMQKSSNLLLYLINLNQKANR